MDILIEIIDRRAGTVTANQVPAGTITYEETPDGETGPWRARSPLGSSLGAFDEPWDGVRAILDRLGFTDYLEHTAPCSVPGCEGTAERPRVYCESHHQAATALVRNNPFPGETPE